MFGAQVSVVSQRRAQAAASTTTGLVTTLLLVVVWTDVAMAWSEHTPQKHITLGCIEHCTHAKLLMWSDRKSFIRTGAGQILTVVLVHLTWIYNGQINRSNTCRGHLPSVGVQLRRALYHTCWRPAQIQKTLSNFLKTFFFACKKKNLLTGSRLLDFH